MRDRVLYLVACPCRGLVYEDRETKERVNFDGETPHQCSGKPDASVLRPTSEERP